ncbi:MAG TPA: DNA ligase D [Trebonia sp.]|nr:DNA ligase D [Trebonia sp.]
MDKLSRYRGKRDGARTPEPVPAASPAPGASPPSEAPIFVVQEHHARRLHWDFRLERDGVLVSWALPKGVPDDPAANHLAVHTEDHPMEYAGFHGQIPRGEYGAGSVTIWDHGTYELVKWDDREVKVVLHGTRLSGGYTLIRTGRSGDKDWLIHRERLPLPAALQPMLAATGRFPSWEAAAWAVEVKWDGVRALAFIEAGRVTLRSRSGKDITSTYPELARMGTAIGHRQVLLDGEVVVLNSAGQPDFEALQSRIHVTAGDQARRLAELTPVTYLAFDVLQIDGRLLVDRPYGERRELLGPLMTGGSGVSAPPSFPGADFEAVLGASLAHGLEGVVAKRLDSRYEPGVRSDNWVKVKNLRRQEVVVAGWKPGKGNREGHVGSLLMGVYRDGTLAYCGHVGTGFTVETLTMLDRKLAPLRRDSSPFGEPIPAEDARSAVWVEPSLVAEVVFQRWTRSGRMRAPAYKGLRDDKEPRDVVREDWGPQEDEPPVTEEAPAGAEAPSAGADEAPSGGAEAPSGGADEAPSAASVAGGAHEATAPVLGAAVAEADRHDADGPGARAAGADKFSVRVDGRTLTLTNLAKVLYPADGFTKAEVLDYYQRISPVLLPHLADRPLTLKRYPNGVDGQSFFQKHTPADTPDWIRVTEVESRSSRGQGGVVRHIVIADLPTLIWAANRAALELHAPMWRVGSGAGGRARPDLIVFDLDPGEPATIVECCRVAEALRPLLAEAGLAALPKTSGGKGLQLYARVRDVTAEEASDQARHFAQALERDRPDLVTSRMTKSLRPGKVLVDWSQNNGSKTTVVPYSLRARTHPTVSTPITWDEVAACRRPGDLFFTAADVPGRVESLGDLWESLR